MKAGSIPADHPGGLAIGGGGGAVALKLCGMAPHEAIRQACLQRFRLIIMTTLAALMGAVPLAFGLGAGALGG